METPLIDGFVNYLHTLTAQAAGRVKQFVKPDTRYRNPDLETTGPQGIATVYADICETYKTLTIRVISRAAASDGHTFFLRWDRLATDHEGKKHTSSGITELMLGTDGKIASIVEYWDEMPAPPPRRSYFAKLFSR